MGPKAWLAACCAQTLQKITGRQAIAAGELLDYLRTLCNAIAPKSNCQFREDTYATI